MLLAEPTRFFSEATCDALLSFVLRDGSLGTLETDQHLERLASEDPELARWLTSADEADLAQALVCKPSWRDQSVAADRLWQVANLTAKAHSLEQQLVDCKSTAQREAIYHFAYGLSHELNNPLANIATRAGVLAHNEKATDRRQMLETIIDNAMRGSEMLGDLMLLARPPQMEKQSVKLAAWFDAFVVRCASWAESRKIKVEPSKSVQSEKFPFDPVAVSEALWCLVRNAIEASSEGGCVAIHVEEVDSRLTFTVRDSGPGLSTAALTHCFDPYFSGREAGRGLGLGLAKALLIASSHSGTLVVQSGRSGGCSAIFSLPTEDV